MWMGLPSGPFFSDPSGLMMGTLGLMYGVSLIRHSTRSTKSPNSFSDQRLLSPEASLRASMSITPPTTFQCPLSPTGTFQPLRSRPLKSDTKPSAAAATRPQARAAAHTRARRTDVFSKLSMWFIAPLFIDPPSYPPPRRGEGTRLRDRLRIIDRPSSFIAPHLSIGLWKNCENSFRNECDPSARAPAFM